MLMEYITSTFARESEPKPKNSARYRNNRAYWRLKSYIDSTYPPGHYIGIANEKIVIDVLVEAINKARKLFRHAS